MALALPDEMFELVQLQNLSSRRELKSPNQMGSLFTAEVVRVCRLTETDSTKVAYKKTVMVFDALKSLMEEPASVVLDKFWTLFQENILTAFTSMKSTLGNVYWDEMKYFLKTFLSTSRKYTFPLVKLLQFANEELMMKHQKTYMSILVICLDNFPDDSDSADVLLRGVNNFLINDTDGNNQIHLLEHFCSSKTVDHKILKLNFNNFETTAERYLRNDIFCSKYSLGTIMRIFTLMGSVNFPNLINLYKQAHCCLSCQFGLACSAAITFFEAHRGETLGSLCTYSKELSEQIFHTICNIINLKLPDEEIVKKFIMWWKLVMANPPNIDGTFLSPPEELLEGCYYSEKNEACPLGASSSFTEEEATMDTSDGEFKIEDLLNAFETDPRLKISSVQSPLEFGNPVATAQPTAVALVAPLAQGVESPEQNIPDNDPERRNRPGEIRDAVPELPILSPRQSEPDTEQAYNLRRRRSRSTRASKRLKRLTGGTQEPQLVLNRLNPIGTPTIAAKTERLFRSP